MRRGGDTWLVGPRGAVAADWEEPARAMEEEEPCPSDAACRAALNEEAFDASDDASIQPVDDRGQSVQVFLVELGLIGMGVVDTVMVGHVGEAALAAASLGGSTTWLVVVAMMGLVGALDPLTSQAFGAKDAEAVARHLRSGIRASFILAALGVAAMLAAGPLFHVTQPASHAAAAAAYCRIEAWGMLPVVLFQTLRLSLMGTNHFGSLATAVFAANAVNVGLNQVLINGAVPLGIPAMGLDGAAWATTLSRWFLLAALAWFSRVPLRARGAFNGPLYARGDLRAALRVIRKSLAIGGMMVAEFGAFAAMGIIAGRCGTTAAAGHAIIQCLTDISYVLPLGIGALGSVQVGQGVGGGNKDDITRAARATLTRGVYGVAVNAAVFIFLGTHICWWFTSEPAVHAVALKIVPVVALYQAADGIRVVAAGCLRGVGKLSLALVSDIIGFWILGIPIGCWLALGPWKWSTFGIWAGFTFGVVVVMAPIVVKAWHVGDFASRLEPTADEESSDAA